MKHRNHRGHKVRNMLALIGLAFVVFHVARLLFF
jgi:hypothetical protein